MTKILKVWLYLILVVNTITVITSVISALTNPAYWVFALTGVIVIAGAALIQFKTQKLGLYLICAASGIGLIFNLVNGINIVSSFISAFLMPLVIYLLMKKTWSEFK